MAPSPSNSKVFFREGLLDLLWQQWAALGVAGSPKADADWCVDLEALVLITTTQGRSDPRLFDEMLDWLWGNAQWVNVQRLRNIRKTGRVSPLDRLAAFLHGAGTDRRGPAERGFQPDAAGVGTAPRL